MGGDRCALESTMYVGHYAPALLARAAVSGTRLGSLFVAAMAMDFGFDALALVGIERFGVKAGARGPLALDAQWMPYSHSLASAVVACAACAGVGYAAGKPREGAAIGLVVASHWFLDALVHVGDVPLGYGESPRVGLGLWLWPTTAALVELGFLLVCAGILWKRMAGAPLGALIAALVVSQIGFVLGPTPSSIPVMIGVALASNVVFAVAAAAVERGTRP